MQNYNSKFKTQDSDEFENLEKAQPAQTPVQSGQPKQKPQENFDVKDQVGKAIETAQQSVFGPTDPAQVQKQQIEQSKKRQEDQKKITNIKNYLNKMVTDEQLLKQQRQKEQQKQMEVTQIEKEDKQEKEMKKQKKEQSFAQEHIKAEQTKAERKLGVGG